MFRSSFRVFNSISNSFSKRRRGRETKEGEREARGREEEVIESYLFHPEFGVQYFIRNGTHSKKQITLFLFLSSHYRNGMKVLNVSELYHGKVSKQRIG